jgi:hypothetical protein
MTLEEFADKHGLVMEVHERNRPVGDPMRYYAHFTDAEVRSENGMFLSSDHGNGRTPEEAIAHYARRIEMKTLRVERGVDWKDIEVPRLVRGSDHA